MLYKANKFTKQISLRLSRNGLDECCENVALHITPLQCEQPPQTEYCYSPCGGFEAIEKESEPVLTLVYDMHDRNELGHLNFLLDSQFAELPCGRYVAKVISCGCEVYTFQIDKRERVNVSHVQMNNINDCCEGKYGC